MKTKSWSELSIEARIAVFNDELGAFGDDDTKQLAVDIANKIKSNCVKYSPFLASNLRRRDVMVSLLVLGLDMPAIDLVLDEVVHLLKEK